jgi:hypothetical protein
MSSEAERVFSAASFILNSRRRQLEEVTLEALLCLNHWGNSGLISVGNHKHYGLRGSETAEIDDPLSETDEPSEGMWGEFSSE